MIEDLAVNEAARKSFLVDVARFCIAILDSVGTPMRPHSQLIVSNFFGLTIWEDRAYPSGGAIKIWYHPGHITARRTEPHLHFRWDNRHVESTTRSTFDVYAFDPDPEWQKALLILMEREARAVRIYQYLRARKYSHRHRA